MSNFEKIKNVIMNLMRKIARQKEIVETCGHPMYIGKKK